MTIRAPARSYICHAKQAHIQKNKKRLLAHCLSHSYTGCPSQAQMSFETGRGPDLNARQGLERAIIRPNPVMFFRKR